MRRLLLILAVAGLFGCSHPLLHAAPAAPRSTESFLVDGVERTGIVVAPKGAVPKSGAPLLVFFHGHGGTAAGSARRFALHEAWPDAVVVYLQGLPAPGGIIDKEGRHPGWQLNPGDQGDRDVKLFDVVLTQLSHEFRIDPDRVYVMGHSNGSRFAHVLWNMRGDRIAALCTACAQGGRLILGAPPRSIFMIAGEQDPIVPYRGQVLSVQIARKHLATDESKATTNGYARFEPAANGVELATYLHPGGHELPQEAIPLVIDFFKRHPRGH